MTEDMPHRLPHLLDSITIVLTTIGSSATTLMLAQQGIQQGVPMNNTVELQLFLLPFIGATLVSLFMVALNPNVETRRITLGRSGFALFIGTLAPQVIGLFHDGLMRLLSNPALLTLLGGCIAMFVYVLSKPFTRGMYERAERQAKELLDKAEDYAKSKQ